MTTHKFKIGDVVHYTPRYGIAKECKIERIDNGWPSLSPNRYFISGNKWSVVEGDLTFISRDPILENLLTL